MPHFITRKQKILEVLTAHDGWVTSTELAAQLNVSDRTVRNEIASLNREYRNMGGAVLTKRGLGYMLNPAAREQLTHLSAADDSGELSDRYPSYIKLLLFLLDRDDFFSIDDLSDQFYRSTTAIRNDLKDIQAYFDRYRSDLQVVYLKNAVCIQGAEENKRSIIKTIVDSTINFSRAVDLDSYAFFFQYEDLLVTYNLVQQMLQDRPEFQFTAIDSISCTIRMVIAAERILNGHTLAEQDQPQLNISLTEAQISAANWLWEQCDNYWQIKSNPIERRSTMYHIAMSCHPSMQEVSGSLSAQVDDYHTCLLLVRCIIYDIRETYLLDLTQDAELVAELTPHIFKKLTRSGQSHDYDVNPFLADIKNNYPFVFEIATYAARCVEAYGSIVLNEDEVGYIAIHLCSSVERLKRHQRASRIYTVLFSHGNDATSQFLLAKLQSFFSSKLYIDGPFPLFAWNEHLDLEPKLIFTTSSCHPPTELPVLVVNPFLSRSDISALESHIERIEKQNVADSLRPFFMPELFFPNSPLKTPDKIISFVSDILAEKGLAPPEFGALVRKREEISSTAIQNNIAIPHPLVFCASQTCIAVVTLPRAIEWFGRKAQYIFFLAINDADRPHIQGMYNFIVNLSDNPALLQQLSKINSFEKFVEFVSQKGLAN